LYKTTLQQPFWKWIIVEVPTERYNDHTENYVLIFCYEEEITQLTLIHKKIIGR